MTAVNSIRNRNPFISWVLGFFAVLFIMAAVISSGRNGGARGGLLAAGGNLRGSVTALPSATFAQTSPAVYDNLPMTATAVAAIPPSNESPGGSVEEPARMVITSGSMRLVVLNPVQASDEIAGYVTEIGGYLVSGNTSRNLNPRGTEIPYSVLTLRIPSDKFNTALAVIKGKALRVESESVVGQDVTQEYTDLQSHLKNFQAAETQLRELMAKAENTEAVLKVYNELVRVRGEIEVIQGRLNAISGSVAYSALNLELVLAQPTPTPSLTPTVTPVPLWRPVQTAVSAADWLGNVFASLADLMVWVVIGGGPLLVIGLITLMRRNALRRRAQSVTTQ